MRHEQIFQSWCLARGPAPQDTGRAEASGLHRGARENRHLCLLPSQRDVPSGQVLVRGTVPMRILAPRLLWGLVNLFVAVGIPGGFAVLHHREASEEVYSWGVVLAGAVAFTWIGLALCWLPQARRAMERGYSLVWHPDARSLEVVTSRLGLPVRRTHVRLDDVSSFQVTFVHCEACVRMAQLGDPWFGVDPRVIEEPTVRIVLEPGASPVVTSLFPSQGSAFEDAACDSVGGGTYDLAPTERLLARLASLGLLQELRVEMLHHRAGYCRECADQLSHCDRRHAPR